MRGYNIDRGRTILLNSVFDAMEGYLPRLTVLVLSAILLSFAHFMLIQRGSVRRSSAPSRQIALLLLTIVAVISIILSLPVSDASRGDLLGLLGLVLTGIFALSSLLLWPMPWPGLCFVR